jgi:hypothetical protein
LEIKTNDKVRFDIVQGKKGFKAVNVTFIGKTGQIGHQYRSKLDMQIKTAH